MSRARARRIKPSTAEGRRRKAELGRIISNPRTLKADREAALAELDVLAPAEVTNRFPSEKSMLSKTPQAVRNSRVFGSCTALTDKAEESILVDRSPVSSVPPRNLQRVVANLDSVEGQSRRRSEARARAVREAETATPLDRAQVLIGELPDHPLQKLAREVAHFLWLDDNSRPKPCADRMARWKINGWLARQPYNRHDFRGNAQTVKEAVDDVYRMVTERDTADTRWFVKRAEAQFDFKKSEPTQELVEPVQPAQAREVSQPVRNPIEKAGIDLAARAALVLNTDSWLTRLAEHSPDMRSQIIAALSEELMRAAHVSGDFSATLYNSLRPRALSRFPERKF